MRRLTLLWLGTWLGGCEFIEDAFTNDDDDDGGPPPLVQTALPQFDIDAFVSNLGAHFDDRYAGAQIVVTQNGQVYDDWAVGSRTLGPPSGDLAMTVDTRLPIASVSKVMGSLALLQVLDDQDILLEQPIHNHLPESWKPSVHPDHFDAGSPYLIRFVNLMRTETALAFPLPDSNQWSPGRMPAASEMLTALQAPADPPRAGDYQNGNFALIRVLMCELALGVPADTTDYDQVCADAYTQYLNDEIFSPLGILRVSHERASADESRGYAFPVAATLPDEEGVLGVENWDSYPRNAGSGGLYLSSMELAEVLAFLVHDQDETLLANDARDRMLQDELGFTSSREGDHGTYVAKGGAKGPQDNRGWRSFVMVYPNDVDVVVLTNSFDNDLGDALRDLYDASWFTP